MQIRGILIPIGGNEDKGKNDDELYTLDYIHEGILYHVVQESGGIHASIKVIPTASSIPKEVGKNYIQAFTKLGCTDIEVLDIRSREDAEKEEVMEKIAAADCVMFSGGDQSKITNNIGNTSLHKLLHKRLIEEPIVIAGTSAGAMMMSQEMIAGGSSAYSMVKGAVNMYKGLGFVPNLIIDSHFVMRGRFGRVAEAIAQFPHLLGVGLAEDTGLIIKTCNQFKVIGSGMVMIFDPSKLTHNNFSELSEDTPMSIANLIVHILVNGDQFSIDERKLEVLPMDAEFI